MSTTDPVSASTNPQVRLRDTFWEHYSPVPGLAVLLCRGNRAKDAELLVLRHENAVPRHAGRTLRASRPGLARRADTTHTAQALERSLSRYARNALGLAPQTGREQV